MAPRGDHSLRAILGGANNIVSRESCTAGIDAVGPSGKASDRFEHARLRRNDAQQRRNWYAGIMCSVAPRTLSGWRLTTKPAAGNLQATATQRSLLPTLSGTMTTRAATRKGTVTTGPSVRLEEVRRELLPPSVTPGLAWYAEGGCARDSVRALPPRYTHFHLRPRGAPQTGRARDRDKRVTRGNEQ
jgi:hypothetical protein